MIRVISVVLNITAAGAFMIVMLFADALTLATLSVARLPMINIMGGVSLNQSERLIAGVAINVGMVGILSLPIWVIGALAVFVFSRPDWSAMSQRRTNGEKKRQGHLIHLATALVLLGMLLLPLTQPEQVRRNRVERHLKRGEIAEGLSLMSQTPYGGFPPHWDPPPRPGYGERRPDIVAVLQTIGAQPTADWVRDAYVDKLDVWLRGRFDIFGLRGQWQGVARQVVEREHAEVVRDHRAGLELLLQLGTHLKAEDREAIQSLLEFAASEEVESKRPETDSERSADERTTESSP